MEVLEIEPLEDQELKVYMVEKEYEETWAFSSKQHQPLNLFSKEYCEFIRRFVRECKPDFITEEQGLRSEKELLEKGQLAKYLGMQVFPVDLPQNVKDYIETTVDSKKETVNAIKLRLRTALEVSPDQLENEWEQNLLAWGRYLEDEIKKEEENTRTSVREAWMVKQILDHARRFKKPNVTCLFICSKSRFEGITGLFLQYDIKVEPIKIEKRFRPDPTSVAPLTPIEMKIEIPLSKLRK